MKTIPESLGNLTDLKILRMYDCQALEEVPVGVSNVVALEELNFVGCRPLKTIPESLENLTKLKILCMFEFEALEEFHVGVSNLLALEELAFAG